MRRSIAILGATGSIGTQALDIIRRHPDRFYAACLTARSASEKLFELVRAYRPRVAALDVEPERIPDDLRFCEWVFGEDSSTRALLASGAQDALCAIVGIAGLKSVWAALEVCERVLLANKEALVTAGRLVMDRARTLGKPILPVDSEHSAIFQCLHAAKGNPVSRILLTASGGALRDWNTADMARATAADVLNHPTWVMGGKITVDCATMLNKGLELMEAHYLFDTPVSDIEVVVHPQSIIHSMVEFADGSIIAQMGCPDMRGPIGYAMGYPARIPYGGDRLDFKTLGQLTFEAPDLDKYPCLALSIEAIRAGGTAPITLNGANEIAVSRFLAGEIAFGDIARIAAHALNSIPAAQVRDLTDVFDADARARGAAAKWSGG
ncbi:MAG: 1-deoxy-D-xylulose-5-phosphate reductoisomerase [Christensenellales bacterium]|jgi:1-deoxy-D-xylulose-5-phosphate reductoisomerase